MTIIYGKRTGIVIASKRERYTLRKDDELWKFSPGLYSMSGNSFSEYMNIMKDKGINYSEVHTTRNAYYSDTAFMRACVEKTGGKLFYDGVIDGSDIVGDLCNHVEQFCGTKAPTKISFDAVIVTGYQKINLGQGLSSTSGYDKDQDGLSNWEEVNTDLLSWNMDGSIDLPTLKYCYENYPESTYVKEGLDRFCIEKTEGIPSSDAFKAFEQYMNGVKILPIRSNPCEKDSDGDGYSDIEDIKPLNRCNNGRRIIDLCQLSVEYVILILIHFQAL